MANWPCAIATRSTGRLIRSFTWSRTVPTGIFDAPTTVQLASSGRSTTVMTRMFFPFSRRASIFTSSKPPERYTAAMARWMSRGLGRCPMTSPVAEMMKEAGTREAPTTSMLSMGAGCAGVAGTC